MLPKLGRGDVLLKVADEQGPGRLRMIFVDLGLVGPELVVLDIVTLVRGNLDLASEEQFVVGDLERLLHVLGLLETDQGVAVPRCSHHLYPRHFPVLFVLVEQAVLEGCVAAACRQITHANSERPAVLGDGRISASMGRAAGRRACPGSAGGRTAAAAAAAAP